MKYPCTEQSLRQTMTDAEFWDHVFNRFDTYHEYDFTFDRYDPLADNTVIGVPCSMCGSIDACGYDSEGNPMIHIQKGIE